MKKSIRALNQGIKACKSGLKGMELYRKEFWHKSMSQLLKSLKKSLKAESKAKPT